MRKHFIDNIRCLIILLLIPYHAAQAFNTWGELNYFLFHPDKIISSFIVFCSPFYMPVMFLLAGVSARYALKKRTYGQFISERVKRLIIPFVFGIFLIGYYIFANDNVLETTEKNRHVTFAIALIAGIADVYMFIWSGKEFGNINTVAKAFTEWFMILALIGNGKHLLNHSGKVANYLSGRSYLFFSIHFLWIVLFQYWFSVLVGNNTMLAYILPVACAYPVTFACAEIAFRIPFMRFLMGQKTKRG